MKHALWKNTCKCTKIKMAVTKIVMAMTETETLMKKNDFYLMPTKTIDPF